MSRSQQPQKEPPKKLTLRNTWILICMLAILITIIGLIEIHVRRLTVHLSLVEFQQFLSDLRFGLFQCNK